MNRKFVYLINPISGTRGKSLILEVIKKETGQQGIPFEILDTNAAGNYDWLKEKIISENITDIIICGGDGTVSQVTGALLGIAVQIGIIPLGSGNGLAFAAKIPKRIDRALHIIFTGKATWVDGFHINDQFSCMLCGLGFDAQVAHDFANQKKRGLATYIKQTIKNFTLAKPYPFILQVDSKTFSTDAFFISIANSNQFGNNFTIAPMASLHDGLLDIVVVNNMSKLRLVWNILKQINSGQVRIYEDKKYHRNQIHYFQTAQLSIQNPKHAPLHIDGDPVDTAEAFDIKVIRNAFKLLMPE